MTFVIVLAILGGLLFIVAAAGIRIVVPYQRGLVERLGRYRVTVEPGLRIIIPFIDRIQKVDMREQVVDVPSQEVITSDNVVVAVDAVIYYEPTDPRRLAYNIANFELAVTKLAQTNLRNVVGDMQLDAALTSRETINTKLREVLDDATDKWGTRVVRVEIQRIDPPADVIAAMHEQMKAERTRRAVVTEAQGVREAAITRAEGDKQAAILSAEGQAAAIERVAEAERMRQITVAEGEAQAIGSVFTAIHEGDPTPDLLSLKYLEALPKIANGRATKIFLPAEMEGLFGTIGGLAEVLRGEPGDGGAPKRRPGTGSGTGRGRGQH